MKKLIILSAEPGNYVPVELEKAAKELNIEACIIDISKCILLEDLGGHNIQDYKLNSGIFVISESGVNLLEVDSDTYIIPRLNEYHLEIKNGILKRLELLGCKLLNTPESMALCNDKLLSQIILNNLGIKTPKSLAIQSTDDVDSWIDQFEKDNHIKYPIIVKTLRGTHGIGVVKVDSRSSLVSVIQLINKSNIDFVIQEFCEHKQSVRVIMIGSEMLACNLRGQPENKDEFRTNSHLGSETDKCDISSDELAVCKKIVEKFGCNFCAIDYIMNDNEMIVLEVNGSPGLEAIQKNWPDKNLAKTVVEYFLEVKKDDIITTNDQVSSDKTDVKTDVEPEKVDLSKTLNSTETVTIHRILDNVEARIDTGAKLSSLHVDDVIVEGEVVKFKRNDITYTVGLCKNVLIKNVALGTSFERPCVRLDITINGQRYNGVLFTLNNRSNMKYEVLVGRNVLSLLGLPIVLDKDSYDDQPESEIYQIEEE